MMVFGTLAIVVIFFASLYLTVFRPISSSDSSGSASGHDARLTSYLAEEERASAYEALRNHLDQMKQEPDIAAVYCRDSSHQWVGETIEFQGDVDFERPSGQLERYRYLAALRGSKEEGWKVVSIETVPAEQ